MAEALSEIRDGAYGGGDGALLHINSRQGVRLGGFRLLRLDGPVCRHKRSRWQFIVGNALDAEYATVYGYRGPGVAAMVRAELDI